MRNDTMRKARVVGLAFPRAARYARAMYKLVLSCSIFALAMLTIPGCGGPRTRVIGAHTMTFEGQEESARLAIDGVAVRVIYDRVTGAYRAPGCDFGPAATLESLAEQVATTSPSTCERLEAPNE